MAAWYELDGWNVAGAVAEYGTKVSQTMAQNFQSLASTIQQSAQTAAQRAELARTAWLTLDQLNSAAISELNAMQAGQVEAQIVARVEAMKSALAQAESFTQAASEARTFGQVVNSVGQNLGAIAAAAELLAEIKSSNASAYQVSQTSMGVLGGLLIGGAVAAMAASTGWAILGGIAGGLLGKYLWDNFMAPALGWTADSSPLFWDSLFDGMNIATSNFFTSAQRWFQVPRCDPLTFDLDGDGIETVPTSAGVLFDHDGDGLKQGTGWIGSDDGFLVLDRNGNGTIDNGSELFGDVTPLYAGGLAADGFAALAQEDTNADGVVSSLDARWNDLRIWRDLNQNGLSDEGELFTLDSLNIASINVASIAHSRTLANGNQIADLGAYTKTDGTIGAVAETSDLADVNLAVDTFRRQFTDQVPLAAGVNALPNMQGSGLVRDLREAMSQSPALQGWTAANDAAWPMCA